MIISLASLAKEKEQTQKNPWRLCARSVSSAPSCVRGTLRHLQADVKGEHSTRAAEGSLTPAFSCLGWQKGFERLCFGMVSWKVLLWSGVGVEQWAAVQGIRHHVPAAPATAQTPEVEGRRGLRKERGTCKVSLCCSTVSSRPGSIPSSFFRLRIT